ncbi:MAG: SDR family NAD(P)-dependent oxidoreductase [Chloroflexi bacterium]|nr:SDR family NAD(P)-dependent oxidoreductase [Chloroflexota bacterium]
MNLGLSEQTVVVLGAASGIGRAIAQTFANEGAHVALVDRAASVVDSAQQIIETQGGKIMSVVADVIDYAAMQQAAAHIEKGLGPVAHVVFAVGIGSGKTGFPFWNLTPEDWPRVFQVNVQGAVNATHAFIPAMIERRNGTLAFLSSVAGQIGSQTDPPYSASKAALINFAQCAAKDLAPYNIRVNTVNPGMVDTPLNHRIWAAYCETLPVEQRPTFDEWGAEKIKRVVPLNRWQQPEDIADLVVFLASTHANNITGQTMNVDGGFVMHW